MCITIDIVLICDKTIDVLSAPTVEIENNKTIKKFTAFGHTVLVKGKLKST